MEEQSYRLILEYFEKTITDEGLTQLQDWIEESPENLAQFSETIHILQASKRYFNQSGQAQQSWERIRAHINKEEAALAIPPRKNFKWMAYAAVALLTGALGLLWHAKSNKPVYVVISNADGKHSKVTLPDNSAVYLGGGSTLTYLPDFATANRTVYLNGEAFFEVVHMAQKHFAVKSGNITTVVLGTAFNMKAYKADKQVTITVKTGKVGIMANVKSGNKLVKYLVPNEQIRINTQNGIYTFSKMDAAAVGSWVNNNFVFYNTALKDIAASLEHHYGVHIQFTDPELGNSKLTAKFNNIPLDEAMENLSMLSGLAYTQKGNQLYFSNNDQRGGSIMK